MVLEVFLGTFGYFGIFLVSFVSSASIIFPVPFFVLIGGFATILNPLILLFSVASGSSLGEVTGYIFGKYSHKTIKKILKKKEWKIENKIEKWFHKNGFLTILLISASPIPTDIVGIFSGTVNYNFKLFLLAVFIGKLIKFSLIIYGTFFSANFILDYFGIDLNSIIN